MIKKILEIAAKTVIGIFVFYLFVSWAVIPLALPWAIRSQGTKILKTTVRAGSAMFNPFLWRLTLKGVKVEDASKQEALGFDKLQVNVSFLGLFKKMYRIEEFLLDGYRVNAVLQKDGTINLLGLLPQPAAAPQPQQKTGATVTAPDTSASSKPTAALPLVVIDDVALTNGQVRFIDQSLEPNFSTMVNKMDIHVTGLSTRPDCRMKVTFQAKLDNKGAVSSEAVLDPFKQPLQMEASITLDQYALQILTPYTGKYAGRTLDDGNLTLRMDYHIADNKISAAHKLTIQRFTFGKKVESKDALNLPFGLAVALLEDPQGRISISLPVKGDMNDPEFEYWHLVGQVVRNFFLKLVTKPFSFLASVIGSEGGTEEFGTLKFVPGKTEITDENLEKLKVLAKGLKERPKLSLEINGTYDPDADWKAMKTDIFEKDYQSLKVETTFDENGIYRALYQRKFGIRPLWKICNSFKDKKGVTDNAALNAAMKTRVIEEGQPDKLALEALAQTRAKLIYDALLAAGFDAEKAEIGPVRPAQASMDLIPLEFTLVIFGGDMTDNKKDDTGGDPDAN